MKNCIWKKKKKKKIKREGKRGEKGREEEAEKADGCSIFLSFPRSQIGNSDLEQTPTVKCRDVLRGTSR